MTLSRKERWVLAGLSLIYMGVSLWRASVSPFPAHGDGCWYDMVARNLASGRGFTENCVWHFALLRDTVTGPIGNYWNPLVPIIVAGFYKLFGVYSLTPILPVLLMDWIVALVMFRFALQRFHSLPIATFSFLVFTLHPVLLSARAGGGAPESFLLFFVTLFSLSLIHASETGRARWYFACGLLGGFAYLARNEGGMSLLALGTVFLWREVWHKRFALTNRSHAWGVLIAAVAAFFLVTLPWEIRNHAVWGDSANAAKYRFFFCRDYWDVWSYEQVSTLQNYWNMGLGWILKTKLTSYLYKLDWWAEATSWPLLLFLVPGWIAAKDQNWKTPVAIYFWITFAVMGFLNSVSQQAGWNGVSVYLPFLILLSVRGIFFVAEQLLITHKKVLVTGSAIALGLVLYQASDNVRFFHRLNKIGGDPKQVTIQSVGDWFARHPSAKPPVVMIHFALEFTYYTGIPSVRIPTHDSLDSVVALAQKYQATHLVLVGAQSPTMAGLYSGQRDPRFRLIEAVPYDIRMENGGSEIQFYEIKH